MSMGGHHAKGKQPIGSERLVGFIGGYLVDQGAITIEQLDQALLHQIELAMDGEILSLGQVLQRLGYVNAQQLARATRLQDRDINSRIG